MLNFAEILERLFTPPLGDIQGPFTCLPPGPVIDQFSWTWGRLEFFLKVEIQNSQHETSNSSTRLLYLLDHKSSTRLRSQDGVPIHIRRRQQDWWHRGQEQGRRNIGKGGNGEESQGMLRRNE